MRFTPIAVDHLVPTYGFLIEQGDSAVLWSSDTGPTERLWEIANRTPNLKAVCLDTSFDNSMQQIADLSLHLTPRTLGVELEQARARRADPAAPPQAASAPHRSSARSASGGAVDIGFLEQGRAYEF